MSSIWLSCLLLCCLSLCRLSTSPATEEVIIKWRLSCTKSLCGNIWSLWRRWKIQVKEVLNFSLTSDINTFLTISFIYFMVLGVVWGFCPWFKVVSPNKSIRSSWAFCFGFCCIDWLSLSIEYCISAGIKGLGFSPLLMALYLSKVFEKLICWN